MGGGRHRGLNSGRKVKRANSGRRHLIEQEREDLQGGGICPVEVLPGTVHGGLPGFFHDPRY